MPNFAAERAEWEALLLEADQAGDDAAADEYAAALAEIDAEEKEYTNRQAFVSSLDLTPTEAPKRPITGVQPPKTGNPMVDDMLAMQANLEKQAPPVTWENPDEQFYLEAAAKSGTDLSTGLPAIMRGKANLIAGAGDDELVRGALSGMLVDQFREEGIEFPETIDPVYLDEVTGKLGYYRPLGNGKFKPTLVNPVGLDSGDALSALDNVVGGAVEAGAAAGGFFLGAPVGGVAGVLSGAAAAASANAGVNMLRRELAISLGVPEEFANKINSDYMMSEALKTAGFELGGPAAAGMIRALRNSRRPLQNDSDTEAVLKRIRDVVMKTDELSRRTGAKFNPTLGMVTDDARIKAIEAEGARQFTGAKSAKYNEIVFSNEAGLRNALRAIQGKHIAEGTPLPTSADRYDIKDLMYSDRETARKEVKAASRTLAQLADSVSPEIATGPYRAIQGGIHARLDALKTTEDTAWVNFRQQIGVDPNTTRSAVLLSNPPDSPINQAFGRLLNERNQSLGESIRRAKESLMRDFGFDPDGVTNDTMLAGPELDLNHLHALASDLKQYRRKLARQVDPSGWRETDVDRLITAVEEQIHSGQLVRRSEDGKTITRVDDAGSKLIRDSYDAARVATKDRLDVFESEALERVLDTKFRPDGTRELASLSAVREVLLTPGDTTALSNAMRMLDGNLDSRMAIISDLESTYRRTVFNEKGIPTKAGHDRFMENYGEHLSLLFGNGRNATDFITNSQRFAKELADAKTRAKEVNEVLSKTFGKRFDPDRKDRDSGLVKDLLSAQTSPESIRSLTRRLESLGPQGEQMLSAMRREGMEHLSTKLMTDAHGSANHTALNNLLTDHKERLTALYGPEYVTDLSLFRDVLGLINAPATDATRTAIETPALKVLRSIFGPLDPIQRRVTAAVGLDRALRQRKVLDVITNPEKLREYVKFSKITPNTFASMQAATAAGINLWDLPDEDRKVAESVQKMNETRQRLGMSKDPMAELRQMQRYR